MTDFEPLDSANVLAELRQRFGHPSGWDKAEVRAWLRQRFAAGHANRSQATTPAGNLTRADYDDSPGDPLPSQWDEWGKL